MVLLGGGGGRRWWRCGPALGPGIFYARTTVSYLLLFLSRDSRTRPLCNHLDLLSVSWAPVRGVSPCCRWASLMSSEQPVLLASRKNGGGGGWILEVQKGAFLVVVLQDRS